jgi:predicted GIY-YIG superfamily endonuclease
MSTWYAYLLRSQSAPRTYVGVSTDPDRRLRQHNGELVRGARSTRAGRPWKLAALRGPFDDRSEAQRQEAAWKRLTHAERLASCHANVDATNPPSPTT